jgi:hypothetical protein
MKHSTLTAFVHFLVRAGLTYRRVSDLAATPAVGQSGLTSTPAAVIKYLIELPLKKRSLHFLHICPSTTRRTGKYEGPPACTVQAEKKMA